MNFSEVFKLNEDLSSKAWMIRNDGKVYAVIQHPYGEIEVPEEALAAGEWLYDHTNHMNTRTLVLEMISRWIRFTEKHDTSDDIIPLILEEISKRPYKFLSKEFIEKHADDIRHYDSPSVKQQFGANPKKYYAAVTEELNQEFCRARFGGIYNTNSSSREMVFRISSTGFNWYNIIWTFVYDNKNRISTVTIVRDEEATGVKDAYYRSRNGELYKQMPVEDFINESGNPVIEGNEINLSLTEQWDNEVTKQIVDNLAKGLPVGISLMVSANEERIREKYQMLKYKESHLM